ncbi:DUF5658 family protein [Candidatus Entotheonella palauensis]|nr:DUF5658 family protein [Candidatus Entotheonella palauensis]
MASEYPKDSAEQRQRTDRRQATTLWKSLRFGGRRQGARRAGEGQDTYVDQPARRVTILVGVILGSSILDAILTLLYIGRGGGEANPIMAMAINSGLTWFVALKMLLTVTGIIMLAIHQNFRLGLRGLYGMAIIYLALLLYHGILWIDYL